MNHKPWFKHYAGARSDDAVVALQKEFSHFGYAAWFKLLEVVHEQGKAGKVKTTHAKLAKDLDSRADVVGKFLASCQVKGRIGLELGGNDVHITVRNWIKKQQKRKPESGDIGDDEPVQCGQEGEGEKKESRERKVELSAEQRTEREPRHEYGRWESAKELVRGFFGRLHPDAVRGVAGDAGD